MRPGQRRCGERCHPDGRCNALASAAHQGHTEIVQLLLSSGAEVNIHPDTGEPRTPPGRNVTRSSSIDLSGQEMKERGGT